MANIFQTLQQKFNQIVSPYKPKQVVIPKPSPKPVSTPIKKLPLANQPVQKTSANIVKPTQPTQTKSVVKSFVDKAANNKIPITSIIPHPIAESGLLDKFSPKVTPKQAIKGAVELTGIPSMVRGSIKIANSLEDSGPPGTRRSDLTVKDNPQIDKYLATLPGTPYKPTKIEKAVIDFADKSNNVETVQQQQKRYGKDLEKYGIKPELAGPGASILALGALGVDLSGPIVGGGKKEAGIDTVKQLARQSKTVEEFATKVDKLSPEIKSSLKTIFKDERNPINNLRQFYDKANGRVLDKSGEKFQQGLLESGNKAKLEVADKKAKEYQQELINAEVKKSFETNPNISPKIRLEQVRDRVYKTIRDERGFLNLGAKVGKGEKEIKEGQGVSFISTPQSISEGESIIRKGEQPANQSKGSGFLNLSQADTTAQKSKPQLSKQSSDEIISQVLKERKFATSVKETPDTAKEVVKGIEESPNTKYNPITNKETLDSAKEIVDKDLGKATKLVFENKGSLDSQSSAVGQLLIKKAQDAGDYTTAIRTVEHLAERATKSGQGVQALAMFGRLTPEGVLRYAGTLINRAKENGKNVKLTEEQAKKLVTQAEELQKLPEGREKVLKTAELLRDVNEVVPPSMLKKVSTIQTMAQLLNPKTLIRNTVGNVIFSGLENVSKLIATGLDVPLSKITGKRSVTGPDLLTQLKGAKTGGKEGLEEALRGVNTKEMGTKFDIPQQRVFKGKILGTAEKALNVGLRVPDRAFYQAAHDESLLSRAKVIAINEGLKGPEREARVIELLKNPTDDMLGQANADGLYRTFQDSNTATAIFTGLKKSLNANKEFGLGDFVIKYPKTPANLLMRSLEYSPIGFIKGIKQISNPLFKQAFNQKEFVDSLGRATVGTVGLTATGIILQKAGILTTSSSKDKDLRALEKDEGIGQYRINVSALKRFISSGFNKDAAKIKPGDTFVSYDWAQPMAVSLAMGGEIGKNQTESRDSKNVYDAFSQIATAGLSNLTAGLDTLAEQPLVSGVQKFFGGQSITDSVIDATLTAPASVIPTWLSQVNQVLDNNTRETYDPNKLKASFNSVLAKIPVLSATLPAKPNTFGENTQRYQKGTNNPWNVFINPAFVTKYLPDKEAQMVLDLYKQTGETKQVPRIVDKKITIDGQTKVLTQDQFVAYQKLMGGVTKDVFGSLRSSMLWKEASPEDQVQILQTVMTKINKEVKKGIFNQPSKQSSLIEPFAKAEASTYKIPMKNGKVDYDALNKHLDELQKQIKPKYDEALKNAETIDKFVKSNPDFLNNPGRSIRYELNNAPQVNATQADPSKSYDFYKYLLSNADPESIKRINQILNSNEELNEAEFKKARFERLFNAFPILSTTYFERDSELSKSPFTSKDLITPFK